MKSFCLLLLLATSVLCDKKPDLEDIAKNHRRAEPSNTRDKKTTKENSQIELSKYSTKAEINSRSQHQQQYHGPTAAPQELSNQAGDYAELQPYESFKYAAQPQDYGQDNYQQSDDAAAYLQHSSILTIPSERRQPDPQQYIQEGRSHLQNNYDTIQQPQQQHQQQQQLYQQEVPVGNHLQTVQQKTVAHKYINENENKATYYVNIPMSQLLAYYQNYGIIQSKNKNSEQQISIPVYMPTLPQNQVYAPMKVPYQPEMEYVPSYPTHTQAVFTKAPKVLPKTAHVSAPAPSVNLVQQLPAASQHHNHIPIDIPIDQAYNTAPHRPQKYQYYITQQHTQSQPQYTHAPQQQQHQLVYENTRAYQDIYSTPSTAYVQDNSLYEQQQSQQPQIQHQHEHQYRQQQQQQYYVPESLAEQYMTQLLHQEPQEQVDHDFTPPQYQAQKFRASHEVTHLLPVSGESEGFHSKPIYSSASVLSQPKTLLDSYVPSHVIAAQDADRYRERPIKLESGFLPSKINFIRSYKKRKTD